MFRASALVVAVFLLLCGLAAPSVAPRDAGDLALAAWTLGVAHPPGYPLYSLLGHAWLTLLPWGNVGYRLNLLSAAAGALACALAFSCCRRRVGAVPAAALALAFLFCAPVLKFSLLGEKYSLHAAFVAALLALAEGRPATAGRRLCASSLLFGLGFINHQSLVLLAPSLWLLWRDEAGRAGLPFRRLTASALPWLAAGLAPALFVLFRLGSWPRAWAVWTRADYGALTLFAGFARPMSGRLAAGLMELLARRCVAECGVVLALAAALGAAAAASSSRARALVAGWLLCGPAFFLLARFDVSGWVARSVLEPALIAPLLLMTLLAAEGLARLPRRAAAVVACAAALAAAVSAAPGASRRSDLAAADYLRDLARGLPPGSAAVVGGDTAIFGLRLAQAQGRLAGRDWRSDLDDGAGAWLSAQAGRRPACVAGLGLDAVRALGLGGPLSPHGLAQRLGAAGGGLAAWELTALRPEALDWRDSYEHDARLSYAFAHYLDAQLEGDPARSWDGRWAVILDPEDYRAE